MTALDQALTLLEVSMPTRRQQYVYIYSNVRVTPPATFTVTFTPTPNGLLPGASNGWTVQVTPLAAGSLTAIYSLPNPGDNPQWPSP